MSEQVHHTPGPWNPASKDAIEQGVYGCGYRIAKMTGGEISRDIANARLIAAAPELLAELEMILSWARTEKAPLRKQEQQRIANLIAKAKGAQA